MSHSPFLLNGVTLEALPSGIAYWPERRTAMVADLHFEKGSGFAAKGALLPPFDTSATLRNLKSALAEVDAETVICLGDSFQDVHAGFRMADSDRENLLNIMDGRQWVWVLGNHDPDLPTWLPGECAEEWVSGNLIFRHEAEAAGVNGEVSGHFHPKARVKTRARRFSGKCFVTDGTRLILPSFGAFTGGLDVGDDAIRTHFPSGFDVHLIGPKKVYRFSSKALGIKKPRAA